MEKKSELTRTEKKAARPGCNLFFQREVKPGQSAISLKALIDKCFRLLLGVIHEQQFIHSQLASQPKLVS